MEGSKKLKTQGICRHCGREVNIIDFTHWKYLEEWLKTDCCEECNIKMYGRVAEDEREDEQ